MRIVSFLWLTTGPTFCRAYCWASWWDAYTAGLNQTATSCRCDDKFQTIIGALPLALAWQVRLFFYSHKGRWQHQPWPKYLFLSTRPAIYPASQSISVKFIFHLLPIFSMKWHVRPIELFGPSNLAWYRTYCSAIQGITFSDLIQPQT